MSTSVVSELGSWTARSGPLHRRLTGALRDAVASGALPPGFRLPAERALARVLSVSRSTVAAAYATLRREGLLEGRRGSGTYVRGPSSGPLAPAVNRIPRALAAGGFDSPLDEVIELTSATVSLNGVIRDEVLRDALADPIVREGHGYAPVGIPALREAIARHLAESGLPTRPEQVVVTSGAQQAIGLVAAFSARRGDRVILESTTFPGAIDAIAATGARVLTVPVDSQGARVDLLRETAEEHGARLAYLVTTHHNPTGVVMSERRRRDLALLADQLDLTVVDDVTLADLWLDRRPPPPVASFASDSSVITIGSMSKLFWGGLRIGWIRASERTAAALARHKVVADLGSSMLSQAVAARLLPLLPEVGPYRRRQVEAGLATLEERLAADLPEWSWERPSGGLTLWVRLPRGDAEGLAQIALRHGVLVLPGNALAPRGDHRDRIRLPLLRDPETLAEGVRRLASAWRAYEPPAVRATPALSVVV